MAHYGRHDHSSMLTENLRLVLMAHSETRWYRADSLHGAPDHQNSNKGDVIPIPIIKLHRYPPSQILRFYTIALPISTLKQTKAYAADPNPKEPLSISDCHENKQGNPQLQARRLDQTTSSLETSWSKRIVTDIYIYIYIYICLQKNSLRILTKPDIYIYI